MVCFAFVVDIGVTPDHLETHQPQLNTSDRRKVQQSLSVLFAIVCWVVRMSEGRSLALLLVLLELLTFIRNLLYLSLFMPGHHTRRFATTML